GGKQEKSRKSRAPAHRLLRVRRVTAPSGEYVEIDARTGCGFASRYPEGKVFQFCSPFWDNRRCSGGSRPCRPPGVRDAAPVQERSRVTPDEDTETSFD